MIAPAGRLAMFAAVWLLGGMVSGGEPAGGEPPMPPDVSMIGVNLAGA